MTLDDIVHRIAHQIVDKTLKLSCFMFGFIL